VRPHRQQPNWLSRPWDSPGKNTGVGCHFLLQCMKVKSENEVAQSCPTLSNPMDCSLPGSSVHGICQATILEWGVIAFSYSKNYILPTFHISHWSFRVFLETHFLPCMRSTLLLGSVVSVSPRPCDEKCCPLSQQRMWPSSHQPLPPP